MGIERSVTRWYVQRQTLMNEMALLEVQLQHAVASPSLIGALSDAKSAEVLVQLARAQEKLRSLGPCPKPMMG